MEPKSPQEKKALSYEKDRRNTYGENTLASRKGIRRKKRRQNRAERRLSKAAFLARSPQFDPDRFEHVESRVRKLRRLNKHHGRLKCADTPLGGVVLKKLSRRSALGIDDRRVTITKIERVTSRLGQKLRHEVDRRSASLHVDPDPDPVTSLLLSGSDPAAPISP